MAAHRFPLRHRWRAAIGVCVLVPIAIIAAVAFAGTSNGAARGPRAGAQPRVPSGYSVAFDDEFSGSALNTALWSTCYDWGCTIPMNHEHEWYSAAEDQVHAGALSLVAREQATHGEQFSSGMVQTNRHFDFRYGLVEVRAKIPVANGTWPAIWLAPANLSWPPEIDIMERLGPPNQGISTSVHYTSADKELRRTGRKAIGTGYHVYAMLWQPHSITWYIDGKRVFSAHVSISETMYPIIDLAVSLAPSEVSRGAYPASLDLDWVRIFQAPGALSQCSASTCHPR